MDIKTGLLDHPDVIALLQFHLDGMHATSPAEHVHALDVSKLKTPDITFWTLWENSDLLGCGALKKHDGYGEIKSMRTHPKHLRKGVGARLLEHIIQTAQMRDYSQLSLETGSHPAFDPALTLYAKYGFEFGDPFADYKANPFSRFMHLEL